MAKVILGDTFRRLVKRGDTIWPHVSHVPPRPPPVDEPEEEDLPPEPQPEPVE